MNRFAVIEAGQVVNVVLAPPGWDGGVALPEDSPVSIGYTYAEGQFTPPPPPPPPPQAELIAATLAKARAMRFDILKVLDGLQASALATGATVGDPAQPLALVIEQLKQGLRDLPQTVDLTPYTTREQMEDAMQFAYYTMAAAAPPEVQSAFRSLVP